MKTSLKIFFVSSSLILSCNIMQGMEIERPTNMPLSDQEKAKMDVIRNEAPEATYRRELREMIIDLCTDIIKFYRWAFMPSALQIYNNDLVAIFYDLILQIRAIAYLEHKNPVFQDKLFLLNDFNWHLDVDLSDESLAEFAGKHSRTRLINETLVKLFSLAHHLTLIREKTNQAILRIAIDKGLGLIINVSMLLNQYSNYFFIERYLEIFKQMDVTTNQVVF